jgi:autotransporter-associated beta strand protein
MKKMEKKMLLQRLMKRIILIMMAIVMGSTSVARAATQYGTGSFMWGTNQVWSVVSSGPYNAAWTNANDAVLEGTSGAVLISAGGVSARLLTFNTEGFTIQGNPLTLVSASVITANSNATISAPISGTVGLTKAGNAKLTISGANNYTGTTTINGGTLALVNSPQTPFRYYKFNVTTNNGSGYNQIGELHYYSNGVWTAATSGSPGTSGETWWANANDNTNASGAQTKFGTGSFPYNITYDFGYPRCFNSYNWATANDWAPSRSPAKWSVSASNDGSTWMMLDDRTGSSQGGPSSTYTWSGTNASKYVAFTNGVLTGGADYSYPLSSIPSLSLPVLSPVRIAPGATLDLNGSSPTIASLADANNGGGYITNSAAAMPVTLTFNPDAGADTVFSGTIADNGSANAISVVKSGAGMMTLAGTNTYSGTTVINGGTLKLKNNPIANHRYYKFVITSVHDGGDVFQASEIAFYSSGTRVFPTATTGDEDGGYFGGEGPTMSSDNLTTTKTTVVRITTGTKIPRYIIFDFGSAKAITSYNWATANDYTPHRNPSHWQLLGSNDKSTWVTLDTQTNAGGTPTTYYTYAAGWSLQSGRLPTTTPLQMASGAVFDLSGNSQILSAVSGLGRVTNGTLVVNGTIAPGGTNVLGTLTVAASATLAGPSTGTGTLLVDVASDGTCDLLAVQGTLNLSALSLRIANPELLNTAKEYTLVTCTGARIGQFASVAVPNSRWHTVYLPDGTIKLVFSKGTLIRIL